MRVRASTLIRVANTKDDRYLSRFFSRVRKHGGISQIIWDVARTKENEECVELALKAAEEVLRLFSSR